MTNSSFLKKAIFALFALSVVLFVSCDDDFNILGADVVGGDIHSDMIRDTKEVVAYDRPTGAVQSNNMLQNQLGIYENSVFGKTVSHFVTQIAMASENPTLYDPIIDSAYLYIPYHTSPLKIADDGKTTLYVWGEANYNTYIFGDTLASFDLKMYRNGYFLRNTDPGAADNLQRYYSDDRQMVDDIKGDTIFTKSDFIFDTKEVQIHAKLPDGTDKVVERKEPGMFRYLNNAAMKEIFLSEANRGNLVNNSIFKDYFRGLYFKVEQTGGKPVMNLPRFSEGTITLKYHDYESKTTGNVSGPDMSKPRISKTITFNLKGNTINFFDNSYNSPFTDAVATSNVTEGDENIYLKGGAGSMAIINLDQEQLNNLSALNKENNILINEANLVFYVDDTKMTAGVTAPPRIYLYDLQNKKPIIDYSMDGTKNVSNSKGDKIVYGGILNTIDNSYRIRLTNHIKNIIKGDSTNVRLGLVVTDDITISVNNRLKTPFTEGSGEDATEVKDFPYASVQSHLGTVIYGKKIKLEIYYSKPKE